MNSLPLFQDRSTSCGKRNRVLPIASAYAEIEKAEAPLLIATHASLQSVDIGAAANPQDAIVRCKIGQQCQGKA